MIDILWLSLALCALGIGTATCLLLLAARENLVKKGQALDSLNRELPAILASLRATVQDTQSLAGSLRQLTRVTAWAGGIFRGFRLVSGLFGVGAGNGSQKTSSEAHHD
jgi:hypothetical protein